jgi:hypothetical protein
MSIVTRAISPSRADHLLGRREWLPLPRLLQSDTFVANDAFAPVTAAARESVTRGTPYARSLWIDAD